MPSPILNISEPHKAIGIDFGTTNSLIAYSVHQNSKVISGVTPSIISYNKDSIIIGKERPKSINIHSIKRLFGKNIEEIYNSKDISPQIKKIIKEEHNVIKLIIDNKSYTLADIASQIFKNLKNKAEKLLKISIEEAVVTTPAYFDDLARNTIKYSAQLAGIKVLRLVNEPTAAAYYYGLNKKKDGTYLVYDLGGGTFDISLLKIENFTFQIIATGGDNMLGGNDIDIILANYLSSKFHIKDNIINLAKKTKEELSKEKKIVNKNFNITLTQFNSLIKNFINKSISITQNVIYSSGINVNTINGIILVGGSTKIKLIKQLLLKTFSIPVINDINPENVVALGAALYAENLISNNKNLIIDVTSLSLGIELMGGLVEKIIYRNTPIPCKASKIFTTYIDNQISIKINIVQGERELVKECRSLGSFELKNIPPLPAGIPKVIVTFNIDANNLLTVTAKEEHTGVKQDILLNPTYGLTNDIVERYLKNAMINSQADNKKKVLQEAILESEKLINQVQKSIKKFSNLITIKKNEIITKSIEKLKISIKNKEINNILYDKKLLENKVKNFLQKIINLNVNKLLKGKKIRS